MSTLYRRKTALTSILAAASLAGKEGYFYKLDEDDKAVIVSSAADKPHGLIMAVTLDGMEITGAPFGGNHGTVPIKLGGNVTELSTDLTLKADGSVEADDGAGARVVLARPLELGTTGEFIECILLEPRQIGNAVALTSTNGTAGAAADITALKAEAEKIGDDVRALYAALQAAGVLA